MAGQELINLELFGTDGAVFEGDAEDSNLAAKVNYLQGLAGGPLGYRLRRIILCNFWLYGLQEFEIAHGRLFLAGENASGKSSVLAASLPLALDGDLRPNRLDTFGGRDRRIDYYVLGGSESSTAYSYERRTTYIALEFEWCNPSEPPIAPDLRQEWLEDTDGTGREKARWLTIGISLAGNVNSSDRIRPLRFVITDGSRFGHELHMVDAKDVALDHPGFKRMLGGSGIVADTKEEYQTLVARYLFGISDLREFQNIINMMLVLRKPNLGSELNFSRVHDYLKQSLRKIPDEITRRVTGTIERIDSIQSQVEHLQDAHDSAARLDNAAQKLAVAGARKAALTFSKARGSEIAAQGQVTRLQNELNSAESERSTAQARLDELTTEADEVAGQIAALEASEGMQLAERLAQVREISQIAAVQLEQQNEQLRIAQGGVQANQVRRERLRNDWQRLHTQSLVMLQTLQKMATERAEWPLAAAQLEEAARQVGGLSLEAAEAPSLPVALEALAGTSSQERVAHLLQLEELHQQREAKATEERVARERENEKLAEYDAARQRKEKAQARVTAAREELVNRLQQLYRQGQWVAELPEYKLAGVVSAALGANLTDYRNSLENFGRDLERAAQGLSDEQTRLRQRQGVQQQQWSDLQNRYQQKLAEPDLVPLRTERRQEARSQLANKGIAAWPLYALIDFKPEVGPERAGQIERMLEEAGLLDALVVRPDQTDAADTLLQSHGLSDCRLLANPADIEQTLYNWLAFDPASLEGEIAEAWRFTVELILRSVALSPDKVASYGLSPDGAASHNYVSLANDGHWQHGLLWGQAGSGAAKGFIGTANRRRLRRQELDALQTELEAGRVELTKLEEQIRENLGQQRSLENERDLLEELARAAEVVAAELERDRVEVERDRAEKVLNETQARVRDLRQTLHQLTTRILQDSQDVPGAANDLRRLRQLLEATRELSSHCALLVQSLHGLAERWPEYREVQTNLESSRRSEQLASKLQAESQTRYTQAQAELDELERTLQSEDLQKLTERLGWLRQRRQELPNLKSDALVERSRAEERARNLSENLGQARQTLEEAQQSRQSAQTTFKLRLAAYPSPRLTEARLLAERDDFVKAAARLLTSSANTPVTADQEQLDEERSRAFNHLNLEFNQERATLAEYGPELDDEGRVTFIVENRVEPPELLQLLTQQIDIQKALLDNEERALFENFLLQEMAEAIRYHIIQTEQWVRSINTLLADLPMVGEHYSLEWKPVLENESGFLDGLGSHIARQHKLLRKPAQNLSSEETEILQDAFRQEIVNLRLRQKEEPGLNFMDALVQIFDYREWFQFSIFITPTGGTRIRLTDRNAGSRSGAEQLFALYVPLFAALAALYDSAAAPGCPRLLALDEAFDKASVANTQRIMEFLVLQNFQWMMTGPQISGTGSGIPASAEYQMMHEKGTLVATAVPFFWIGGQEAGQ